MNERGAQLTLTAAEAQRIVHVLALAERGEAAMPALLETLSDPSWTVRREAVAALGRLGKTAAAALCHLLKTRRESEARIAATVDALVASADDIFDDVSQLASDGDPAIVADCAQILGRREVPRAVPLLAKLVEHADDNVAVAAIEALGRIGGARAIETLLAAARSGNFFRVFPAIDVLGRSGDPRAIPALVALLGDPTYALEAARALGKTGETAAVKPLTTLLSHPSEATIRVASLALYELQARNRERYGANDATEETLRTNLLDSATTGRLVRCLAKADAGEQLAIAFVLGSVGGEPAVAGLRTLLDVNGSVAEVAASALRKLGQDSDVLVRQSIRDGSSARRAVLLPLIVSATAAPELIACLGDDDPAVRALACDALARVGATSGVSALFALLEDANPRVVQAAIGAIQSLGSGETQTLALRAAKHQHPAVRRNALRILAYFGFSAALPVFLEAAKDPDQRTLEASLTGLAFLEDPRALDALFAAAREPNEKTRSAAMRAIGLGAKRDSRSTAYLLAGLKDQNAWVRYYACQALGRLDIDEATDVVATLIADPAGQVRVAAIEALSHFHNDVALLALRRAAEGNDLDVQRAALIGLGIAKQAEGIAVVLRAAQAPDPATRLVAVSALSDSASPHVLPALTAAAHDVDENVRAAAIGFLAAVPGAEGTAILIDLVREPKLKDRVAALLSTANEGRVAAIMTALGSADDDLALVLTSALARMRSGESSAALVHTMSLPWVPARKAAASALASLRTAEAIACLKYAAERDADPQVRQISAVLLGQ